MSTVTHDKINRADLAGWDREAIDLVMEAQEFGWAGRVSSKGHVILRAPDGESTMSVSRRWSNGRSGPNMRANFDRWLKGQREGDVSFEQFSDAWDAAEQERFIATMIDGLTRAAGEFGGDDAERTKVIYRNILESPKVAPFAYRVGITESRIRDFGLLIGYSDEIAEENKRPWNVNWAVYDARSMAVVDFGGPRMMDGRPWDEEMITLLVVEKVRREREEAQQEGDLMLEVEVPVDDDERTLQCDECDRRFKRPMHLARHKSTTHKPALAFVGEDPGLDDVWPTAHSSEPVTVQMDNRLTVVADRHVHVDEDGWSPLVSDGATATAVSAAMASAIDGLGIVARRMAFLENERGDYEARIETIRRECDEKIATLTAERDHARQSVDALKSLVADL